MMRDASGAERGEFCCGPRRHKARHAAVQDPRVAPGLVAALRGLLRDQGEALAVDRAAVLAINTIRPTPKLRSHGPFRRYVCARLLGRKLMEDNTMTTKTSTMTTHGDDAQDGGEGNDNDDEEDNNDDEGGIDDDDDDGNSGVEDLESDLQDDHHGNHLSYACTRSACIASRGPRSTARRWSTSRRRKAQ